MKIKIRMRMLRRRLTEDRYHQGLGGPPNGHQHSPHYSSNQRGASTGIEWYSIWFNNDASDVMIAEKFTDEDVSKWAFSIAAEDFRRLALWYIRRWAWGEWFGLRRWLFYWFLDRDVAAMIRRDGDRSGDD